MSVIAGGPESPEDTLRQVLRSSSLDAKRLREYNFSVFKLIEIVNILVFITPSLLASANFGILGYPFSKF